ncbi:MAG TPA: HK97 gp10 family phage protein [Candidatus Atribacteria bacterium]|nr:HK97 gp10 family phage protein [Candidatus Atribacteria bacterium]
MPNASFKSTLNKEVLGRLDFLTRVVPTLSDRVVKRFVTDIAIELREQTPVSANDFDYIDKGRLKEGWYIKRLGKSQYEIGNPEEYIMIVEYGANKLSDDPKKKANSLRFLYANGVFTPDYEYIADDRVKKEGWIRLILSKWQMTILALAKRYYYEITFGAYKTKKLGAFNEDEYRTFLK